MHIQVLNQVVLPVKSTCILISGIVISVAVNTYRSPLAIFKINICSQYRIYIVTSPIYLRCKREELPSITNFIITITVAIYSRFVCATLCANTIYKIVVALTWTYYLNSKCFPLLTWFVSLHWSSRYINNCAWVHSSKSFIPQSWRCFSQTSQRSQFATIKKRITLNCSQSTRQYQRCKRAITKCPLTYFCNTFRNIEDWQVSTISKRVFTNSCYSLW